MQIKHAKARIGALLVTVAVGASACGGSTAAPQKYSTWSKVLAAAKGQNVNFYLWGGDPLINSFVTGYVAQQAQKLGITIREVQISDTVDAVNKVLGEKQAGQNSNGTVDLIWINGQNFFTMVQAHALYCGWVSKLPNSSLVDYSNPEVSQDFGLNIQNCEAPWTLAQFCMIYDSAKVPSPPTDVAGLVSWIKANPGKFTYPAPPDFTGAAFLRQLLYYTAGGYKDLLGPFTQAKYNKYAPALWNLLNQLKPYLWRQGSTYPQAITQLDSLYENGEVAWDMTYGPTETVPFVQKGTWPASTRELVFQPAGMIGDVSYVAIPYNSPHQAAAQVIANILLSVEAQYKAIAAGSLGYPAIDVAKLPAAEQKQFNNYPVPAEELALSALTQNSDPELVAEWSAALQAGWTKNVLQH